MGVQNSCAWLWGLRGLCFAIWCVTTGAGWRSFVYEYYRFPKKGTGDYLLNAIGAVRPFRKGGFIRWFLDNLGYRPPEVDAKTKTKGGALWR